MFHRKPLDGSDRDKGVVVLYLVLEWKPEV